MDHSIEKLLDEREVAEVIGVSAETIADWRKTGAVPLPFVRIGPRLIRYRRSDVLACIAAGQQPTASAA